MKIQLLPTVLTIVNLVLLTVLLWRIGPAPVQSAPAQSAPGSSVASVIRGHALEIVDEQGRVRASIKVHPAHTFKPTGKKYPDTVVLRLIDPNGRPEVKIGASEQGGGLSLVGASDTTQVLLEADGMNSSVKLTDNDGKQQIIKP